MEHSYKSEIITDIVPRLSKRERRILRQEGPESNKPSFKSQNFKLRRISPMTDNQQKTFDAFADGMHLFLHGIAGTGKSFISLYLCLRELMGETSQQNRVVIVRSVVPTRDMGFLPGNVKEKAKVYEAPYAAICAELYGRGDAYEVLKQKSAIEFMSTSFVRGITLNDCYVIVDEAQNMTYQELDSIMTRVGKNCRIIFSGDLNQDDLTSERKKEHSGIRSFMRIVRNMKYFEFIELGIDDIVRSEIVKEYLIEKYRLNL